ncbi:MAG: hypothetical protein KDI06_13655 [Calditrichaeota bacterium]|nr:hypothetical protein [Calditrichota bacterium]
MKQHIQFLLSYFCCLIGMCLPFSSGIAQEAAPGDSLQVEENLYQALRLAAELTLQHQTADSLYWDLLADADALARAGDPAGGREILSMLDGLMKADLSPTVTPLPLPTTPTISPYVAPRFILESGVDYSVHEFENAGLESDSTLREEFQNPYLSLSWYQLARQNGAGLELVHRFRVDQELQNYQLLFVYQPSAGGRLRLNGDAAFYQNDPEVGGNFLNTQLGLRLAGTGYSRHSWTAHLQGRIKAYLESQGTRPDLYSGFANLFYAFNPNPYHQLNLGVIPSFYREAGEAGYRYEQLLLTNRYRWRGGFNHYWEIDAEVVLQSFESFIEEDPYRNRYSQFHPQLQFEQPLGGNLSLEGELALDIKNYRETSYVYPDYRDYQGEILPKINFSRFRSLALGWGFEKRVHDAQASGESDYLNNEDYRDSRLVVRGEWYNLSGLLVSADYRLSWRSYAEQASSLLDGYESSDRLIHAVSVLGWIPLGRHWQIQMLINYDNDQDRRNDFNDFRSTLMNIGVGYQW